MTYAKLWLVGGMFLAMTVFQVPHVAAQQFPGFSKKLNEVKLSQKVSVIVYLNTKGKKQVGLIRGRRRTALQVKFSPSTFLSNFTLIGESLFFIAEDKAWSVNYFWTPDPGRLHFVATNAARKKTVTSKGLRKNSLAYPFLINPGPKGWWLAEQKGRGEDISAETSSFLSFHFGASVLDRRTVLLAYEIRAQLSAMKSLEASQAFLYRLRGDGWKPKRINLNGLPRSAPDLNGDGTNEVVMVGTSYFKASTTAISELIWWDSKAARMKKSGIKAEDHFGDAPLNEENKVFKESTLQFLLKAKPFPIINVKGQRKKQNRESMEIEILENFELKYQWNPAKREFMRIRGK